MRAAVLLATLAVAGCGAQATAAPEARHRVGPGMSLALPDGWGVAPAPVTALAYPSERLVAATYHVAREAGRESCGPVRAVRKIPPGGALVFLLEYEHLNRTQLARFPPRPARARLPAGPQVGFECFGTGRLLLFRERGRAFQAMVALGPRATAQTRRSVLLLLDSLRVAA